VRAICACTRVKCDCTCFPVFARVAARASSWAVASALSLYPKFALTGSNQECLLRTEAPFFDSKANPISQFGRRVSKIGIVSS